MPEDQIVEVESATSSESVKQPEVNTENEVNQTGSQPNDELDTPQTTQEEKPETVINEDQQELPRQERRIKKYISQLKEKDQEIEQLKNRVFTKQDDSLLTKEDLESGSINPDELLQRYQSGLANERNRIKAEIKAETEFELRKGEHERDMDEMQQMVADNPRLEQFLIEQYDLANTFYDPYSGNRVYNPTVKMSELYKKFQPILENFADKKVVEIGKRVVSQSETSAVQSGGSSEQEMPLEELRKNMWRDPDAVARAIEQKYRQ